MESQKTLVVFLDGADWPLLQPLLDRGWLPALQRLVAQGTSASLMGFAPFSAPMLLASAVTGHCARRHRVVTTGDGDTTVPRPCTATLWDIATAAGLPSLVVGGHAATPDRSFSGVFVAEPFFGATACREAVLPFRFAAELEPLRVTPETLDPGIVRLLCPRLTAEVALQDPLAGRLGAALARLYSVHNVAASLLETEPWRLSVVHHSFLATIRQCFGHLDRPETPTGIRDRYDGVVAAACRLLDLLLRQLLACAGDDARVIVASLRGEPALDPQLMADYPLRHPGAGCLIASGPGLRQGARLGTFNVLDLAPTILHSLGQPCRQDHEGRVLDELFADGRPTPAPAPTAEPTPIVAPSSLPDPIACFNLGVDLFEAARCAEALPHLRRALSLRPESPVFAFWLACCLARLALDDEVETASEVLRDHASDPRWQIAARLAVVAGQGEHHGQILNLVPLPVTPGTLPSIAVSALAHALMTAGRLDDAVALLRDHLALQPSNEIWMALARCYLHSHRYRDAEKAARHVIADNPGLAFAHLSLARALLGSGQNEQAEQALREAHRLAPQVPEVRAAVTSLQPALARQLAWRTDPAPNAPVHSPLPASVSTHPVQDFAAEPPDDDATTAATIVLTEPGRLELIFRPVRTDEAPRVAGLLGDPNLVSDDWNRRVWESKDAPRRFVGAAAWRPAPDEIASAHLAIALLPRFLRVDFARALVEPLLAEIERAGLGRTLVTTRAAAEWEAVFHHTGRAVEHWTDETWTGDPLLLRERLRRYDAIEAAWSRDGWGVRPLAAADWELVWRWGVATDYLTPEHFARLRPGYQPALSGVVVDRDGPAGVLVATRHQRTATLEFIGGAPDRPGTWGTATALLFRRFVEYAAAVPSFDDFVITTNLRRDVAMHTPTTRLKMRRTREHHHFLLSR